MAKADAATDDWAKDLAPSHELRRWFAHEPTRFDAFRSKYHAKLDTEAEAVQAWIDKWRREHAEPITLVYAARDDRPHHAPILLNHFETSVKPG